MRRNSPQVLTNSGKKYNIIVLKLSVAVVSMKLFRNGINGEFFRFKNLSMFVIKVNECLLVTACSCLDFSEIALNASKKASSVLYFFAFNFA